MLVKDPGLAGLFTPMQQTKLEAVVAVRILGQFQAFRGLSGGIFRGFYLNVRRVLVIAF